MLNNTYQHGQQAEALAKKYLEQQGYTILAERYLPTNSGVGKGSGAGELDLVIAQDNTLIFIEVKARPTVEDGLYAITEKQQRRIRNGAQNYLAASGYSLEYSCRFDVLIVLPNTSIKHVQNAF